MDCKWMRLAALLAVAMLAASCAGKAPVKTPEPTPQPTTTTTTPTTGTPAVVSQADLDALLGQVQALKKKAFDLKLYEVLPDAYKTADASYAEAKGAYDAKDQAAAKDKLGVSIGLFKDLNAKGIVELSSMRRKEADDLKAAALKAGAESSAADRFGPAGLAYSAGVAAADAGNHEAAIASFERARLLYDLAWKRAGALSLKATIADKGYAAWDSGNATLADAKLADEEQLYTAAGGAEMAALPATDPARFETGIDNLDEAILRYNLVIQKARTAAASQQKAKADDGKQRSEAIKANVAAKEDFAAALAEYQAASQAFASGEFETAASGFEAAAQGFEKAYTIAADKRAKAAAAMEAAAAAAEESRKKAQEGDTTVGGASSGDAPPAEVPAPAEGTAPADGTTSPGDSTTWSAGDSTDATSSATAGEGN